jgi:hypothetical protein
MVAATPASVEHAFADRGVLVLRVARAPEICGSAECVAVELWEVVRRSTSSHKLEEISW